MQHDTANEKAVNKIQAPYTLEGMLYWKVLKKIKYLSVTITTDFFKWNTRIINICIKANGPIGFLRRNLFSCPQDVTEAAYK